MLNLLNSNNSKKLADLLEEELNELNNNNNVSRNSDENCQGRESSGSEGERLEEREETGDEDEVNLTSSSPARRRSSSSCSNSSSDDLYDKRRSHSAGSNSQESTSPRIVSRKVKRIGSDQSEYASETELNLKKKYSCFNYEDECVEGAGVVVATAGDEEFSDDQFEEESASMRTVGVRMLELPKTSSRSGSQENLCGKGTEKKRFDDRVSWEEEGCRTRVAQDEGTDEAANEEDKVS